MELDDGEQEFYTFQANPAFLAFLAAMRELIHKPNHFFCYTDNRVKPYF